MEAQPVMGEVAVDEYLVGRVGVVEDVVLVDQFVD